MLLLLSVWVPSPPHSPSSDVCSPGKWSSAFVVPLPRSCVAAVYRLCTLGGSIAGAAGLFQAITSRAPGHPPPPGHQHLCGRAPRPLGPAHRGAAAWLQDCLLPGHGARGRAPGRWAQGYCCPGTQVPCCSCPPQLSACLPPSGTTRVSSRPCSPFLVCLCCVLLCCALRRTTKGDCQPPPAA